MSKDNQRERQGKVYDPAFARASMSCLSIPSFKDRVQLVRLKTLSWPRSLSVRDREDRQYQLPLQLPSALVDGEPLWHSKKQTWAKRVSEKMKVLQSFTPRHNIRLSTLTSPEWPFCSTHCRYLMDIHLVLLQVASCRLFIYSLNCGISFMR